jgi:hypothetical protein
MRALFILLVLANVVFFALKQGWFGTVMPQQAEPQRLQAQVSAQAVKVINEAGITTADRALPATSPVPLTSPAPLSAAPSTLACLEWGAFSNADAQKAAALLTPLGLGAKLTRSTREESATHMVLMGPYVERPETERRAAELRRQGLADVAVVENAQGRFVSLGIFSSAQGAQVRLAEVRRKGTTTARVVERSTTVTRDVFQVKEIDTTLEATLRGLSAQMNGAPWVPCLP